MGESCVESLSETRTSARDFVSTPTNVRIPLASHDALLWLALAAICIVLVRAWIQSITIDEAGSFLAFSLKRWPSHWWPASDNHVLNSILMRLSITVFGVNTLAVRLPALLGAVAYISSAVFLSRSLCRRRVVQSALFIGLVFNPMILDYLIAARGYSLALGLMMAVLAVIAGVMMQNPDAGKLEAEAAWVSVLLALSCAANFSFAIADGTILLTFFLWAAHQTSFPREYRRLALRSFLPGIVVGFSVCGSVLSKWPQGELYFGSKSIVEMLRGFANGSFDELNPHIVNPLVFQALSSIGRWLPYLMALTGIFVVACAQVAAWSGNGERRDHWRHVFVRFIVIVSAITLLLHWSFFKLRDIPLPKDRTGLYFLSWCLLAFAGSVAICFDSRVRWPAWCGTAVLWAASLYFMGCLRLDYFKEWRFDSDTKTLYRILANIHRDCGIDDFGIDWRYQLPLNFYREANANYLLREFSVLDNGALPEGRPAYAVFFPSQEDFIKQHGLRVIYHDEDSGSAVAIVQPVHCVVEQ